MASTNSTTNYGLSQYIGSDKPTYLGDYNSDMLKIDAQMKLNADAASTADGKAVTAKNTADAAQTAAETADGKAVNAQNTADTASSTATNALSKANSNETAITNMQTYSTTETAIGTWGASTLYRKIVNFGALPNNSDKSVAHGITNLNYFTHIYGVSNNGSNYFPLPTVALSGLSNSVQISADSTNVHITTGTNRTEYTTTYVVLEYVKTA